MQISLLASILGKQEADIRSFERVGQEFGLSSEIYRTLLVDGSDFAVKAWPSDSPVGDREIRFFEVFGADLGIDSPKCISSRTIAGQMALVLQWVSGRQGDMLEPFPSDAVVPLATALARFHRRWFNSSRLDQKWLPTAPTVREDEWYEKRTAAFMQRFGKRLPSSMKEPLMDVWRWHPVAVEGLQSSTPTLLHNDLHTDNLLFPTNNGPVVLDWAGAAKGAPAIDVAAIAPTTESESEFIAAYRDAAPDLLKPEQYRWAKQCAFVNATLGIANFDASTERNRALVERTLEFAERLRTSLPT